MIDDAELLAMRATLDQSLPDTATVYRLTAGTMTGGFASDDRWTVAHAAIACRLSPASDAVEVAEQGSLVSRNGWTITFPAGTVIDEADVVVVDGTVFEVVGSPTGRSYEVATRARCVLRRDQTLPVVAS